MTTLPGQTIIATMRRLLIVLIVLMLPLQWSTAAVAAYCGHEVEASAQKHLGHHEHEHHNEASSGAQSESDTTDQAAFDADCPTCHFLATPAIFSSDAVANLPPTPQSIAPYVGAVTERYPDTPFRPPLTFLA